MKKGLFIIGLLVAFLGNAQISSISNGESGSSVRTKLNAVIDRINDLETTDEVTFGNLNLGDGTSPRFLHIDGASGRARVISIFSNGSERWSLRVDNTAESGSDAGSNFTIRGFDDAGSSLGNYVSINRASGQLSLLIPLEISSGGTGASDAAGARTNLGLGALATLSTINNSLWSGDDLTVANGGTGASDAATAATNLGLGTANDVTFQSIDLSSGAGTLEIGSADYGANSIVKSTLDFDINVTSGYLGFDADSIYLNNFKITNLADPVNAKDAANRQWVLAQVGAGGGLSGSGVPVNNQIGVWVDANTLEGDANFTWDGDALNVDDININGEAITSTSGDIALGNFDFDANQTVGASQDDYVLTYDDASGKIALEFATGGVTLGTNGQIPYMNVAGTDLEYRDELKWNNTGNFLELYETIRLTRNSGNGNIFFNNIIDTTSTIIEGGTGGAVLSLSGGADSNGATLSAGGSAAGADLNLNAVGHTTSHVRINADGGVDLEIDNFNELEVSSGLVEVQNDFGVLGKSDFAGSVNLTDETNYINNTRVSHSFGASNPDYYTIISSSNLSSVGEVMILFVTAGTLTGSHYYTCQVLVSNSGSIVNIEPIMDSAGILSIVDDGSGNLVARKTGTGTPNVRISYLRIL